MVSLGFHAIFHYLLIVSVINVCGIYKNENIILHHVLPNCPENIFLVAFVILKLQQQ